MESSWFDLTCNTLCLKRLGSYYITLYIIQLFSLAIDFSFYAVNVTVTFVPPEFPTEGDIIQACFRLVSPPASEAILNVQNAIDGIIKILLAG